MKPYVICHMVCTVDGKTQGARWDRNKKDGNVFEDTAAQIKSQGWIVGRKTMSEFSAKKPRTVRKGHFAMPKTDYTAPHDQETYAVALDPSGKLSWDQGSVDTEHVISILTHKVSAEYLDYLRSKGVSYIFAGKSDLNLKQALEKLNKRFGIKRITVQGGGTNNGSFLEQGLIDEISVVIMPFADGGEGVQSVFDIKYAKRLKADNLRLKSHKLYKKQYVWLRYDVV